MGMGVGVGIAPGAPSLLAAPYGSTAIPTPTPTAAVAHHSLLTRPLLHPLQPTPAKKLKGEESPFAFKTGASRTPELKHSLFSNPPKKIYSNKFKLRATFKSVKTLKINI